MEYILSEKSQGCIFCEKPGLGDDRRALIVHRGKTCFVILNLFPYNNGHLMVVPFRHVPSVEDLDESERCELMALLAKSIQVLRRAMNPHGFNIGANLGTVAGAGVADHVHFHIVPRWEGDTNFMPVVGQTKVIHEALERTWEKLVPLFGEIK
ncbi:MAG: HIT domain-containing protein [candidate division KSB1 bacterium]|nr:HIT domain-containing protein [candidate division KSB1 bacterium]